MKNLKRILLGVAILSIGYAASANAATVTPVKAGTHITQTKPTTDPKKGGGKKGSGHKKHKGGKKPSGTTGNKGSK